MAPCVSKIGAVYIARAFGDRLLEVRAAIAAHRAGRRATAELRLERIVNAAA